MVILCDLCGENPAIAAVCLDYMTPAEGVQICRDCIIAMIADMKLAEGEE